MVDAGIGRLLIASLHQGIVDMAPERLPFYENWLTAPGLSGPRFGLASLHAVLSFLRLEGQASYERIMRHAGTRSADWMYAELAPLARTCLHGLPLAARSRVSLHLSRRLVKQTFRGSRARTRFGKGVGRVEIAASIFCAVRERTTHPMCVFYAAAVERLLQHCGLDAGVELSECKAAGARRCTMAVSVRGARLAAPEVEAA